MTSAGVEPTIGGFIGLETPRSYSTYHADGLGLANGRSCLRAILEEVKPDQVFVPYYCCDSLLQPIFAEGIAPTFYHLSSELEPLAIPELDTNQVFIYINYFGLKNDFALRLSALYGDNLIVDNTQNFFAKGTDASWSFNSARKFFGVPDGGYLYGPRPVRSPAGRNRNFITEHLTLRAEGRLEESFRLHKKNEALQASEITRISAFTEIALSTVDYRKVAERRRKNFEFYSHILGPLNAINFAADIGDAVPYCYPFVGRSAVTREQLYSKRIYPPFLWREVVTRDTSGLFGLEKKFASDLLPLPLDQRYDEDDLVQITEMITDEND